MIAIRAMSPARASPQLEYGAVHRAGTDPKLLIAAMLFVAVMIAEALFIAIAAPSNSDVGTLFVTTVT
jgi:hypothetical protein